MKVTLLNYTPQPMRTMAAGALLCYQKGGPEEAWAAAEGFERCTKLLKACIEQDHGSVLEHASFTFGIEGISRACSHQLVRHRLCSFSQQSQRYVNLRNMNPKQFVMPPSLDCDEIDEFESAMNHAAQAYNAIVELLDEHGVEGQAANEDARFVLPNACPTNIIWTVNFRQLMHVAHVRLCKRAQWEIRGMMEQVRGALYAVADQQVQWLAGHVQPMCQHLGYCPQGKRGCGDYPTKDEVLGAAMESGLYQSK